MSLRICQIQSNEHDTKHGARSEPEQPLALEHRDEPGMYFVPTGNLAGNKGDDIKRAGASARTNNLDRYSFQQYNSVGGSLCGEG
jgi:hypothetical protein